MMDELKDLRKDIAELEAEVAQLTAERDAWRDDALVRAQNTEHAQAKVARLTALGDALAAAVERMPHHIGCDVLPCLSCVCYAERPKLAARAWRAGR